MNNPWIKTFRTAAFVASLAATASPAWATGTLEISGGTTPQKDVLEPKADAIKQATGVEIKVNGVGTGNGMLALIEGKVTVATVGDSLPASIEAAKKAAKAAGKEVAVPANLVFTEIGKDELIVVVHKSNPVTSLTKAQLKDLGTGKTTNWKEVGGPDLPVKIVTTKAGLVPGQFFQKAMMDDAAYAPGAIEAQSPREVITWVSRTPGAFGPATDIHFKAGSGDAKQVQAPAMVRPLALVTIGAPAGEAKKVADFLRVK
jgi:phosphate transport system substrate-binding protein